MTAAKADAGEQRGVGDRCLPACAPGTRLHAPRSHRRCVRSAVSDARRERLGCLFRDSGRHLDVASERTITDIYAPFWEYAAKALKDRYHLAPASRARVREIGSATLSVHPRRGPQTASETCACARGRPCACLLCRWVSVCAAAWAQT
jgi:hypothetical protein